MPYARPTLASLQQQAISDISTAGLPGISGGLLPQSILGVLAYVLAALTWSNYSYLDWIANQCTPFQCSGEYLDAWSNLKNVFRKAATPATGSVTLTGTNGTFVSSGVVLQRGDGFQYTTIESGTVASGSLSLAITATASGSIGNAATGIALTIANPIAGMNANGLASSDLTGGTDLETDSSLRTRMLQVYGAPSQGGALSDYVTWAEQCPGVTRAWSATGPAAGMVTVYTMFDVTEAGSPNFGFPAGSPGGATAETRIAPATEDLLAVANYLFPLRPATALVYSAAPQPYPIDFTIANLTPNTTDVQTGITAALTDLFVRIGSPLGQTIYISDVYAACESVVGISEFSISSPSGTTAVPLGYLPTLGTITF